MRSTPVPDLHLNTRLLPALVGLLLVLQLVVPYRGWLMLLVGLGGAWLVSFLWARSLGRGLRLMREMRFGWAQVGDRLEERFTLVNAGFLPGLWVEVVDHATMPDYSASRVTGVGGTSQVRWHTEGVCTCRGLFTLGPTTLRTGDPLDYQFWEGGTGSVGVAVWNGSDGNVGGRKQWGNWVEFTVSP